MTADRDMAADTALEYRPVSLPAETEALTAFLSGEEWPFHSRERLSREEVASMIEKGRFSSPDQRTLWIVEGGGARVGLLRLFDLEDAASGDGYPLFDLRISSAHRRRGIGEHAVRWLTRHLFGSYPALQRIEGTTRVDNAAMRRVFHKCGYAKEGHYRRAWHALDGSLHDATHYAILRDDWERGTVAPVPWISDVLLRHRSIRSYKPDPIDPALVEEVCGEAIAGSSSSGNLNSVTMVLTRDPERKRRLFELHFEQEMVLEAPLVMTFCADWYRTREWLRRRGARDNFNNLIGYHVAAFDAMILAQTVCLGFEARGLGICYMGTTLHSMTEIAAFLDLPDTCLPVTTIVVGYPNEDPPKRDRLPLAAFLHDETYRRPTDAELEATYAQREIRGWARYMAYPELKAKIESLGITSLAQFYTSKAKYDPDGFREDSAKLRALLESKHFLP